MERKGQDGAENKYVYRSVFLEVAAALLEFDNNKKFRIDLRRWTLNRISVASLRIIPFVGRNYSIWQYPVSGKWCQTSVDRWRARTRSRSDWDWKMCTLLFSRMPSGMKRAIGGHCVQWVELMDYFGSSTTLCSEENPKNGVKSNKDVNGYWIWSLWFVCGTMADETLTFESHTIAELHLQSYLWWYVRRE